MVYFDLSKMEDTTWLADLGHPEKIWTFRHVSVGTLACVLSLCVPTFTLYRGLVIPRRLNEAGCRDADRVLRSNPGRLDLAQWQVGSMSLTSTFWHGSQENTYPEEEVMDQLGRTIAYLWERELAAQLPGSDCEVRFIPFDQDSDGTTVAVVRKDG